HVVSPREDERDGKTDQQKHDDKTQRPIRQFPRRKNRRTNLNDECRSDDIRSRDAIDFPSLQFREEAAHRLEGTSSKLNQPSSKTPTRLAWVLARQTRETSKVSALVQPARQRCRDGTATSDFIKPRR